MGSNEIDFAFFFFSRGVTEEADDSGVLDELDELDDAVLSSGTCRYTQDVIIVAHFINRAHTGKFV